MCQVQALCGLPTPRPGLYLCDPAAHQAPSWKSTDTQQSWSRGWSGQPHPVPLSRTRTHVVDVVPGLDEASPEGQDGAAPPREQGHGLREEQHVVDGGDEAQSAARNLLLQTAQPRLKQDGGDTCRPQTVSTLSTSPPTCYTRTAATPTLEAELVELRRQV